MLISLVIEAATFVLLFPRFVWGYGYDLGGAAWYSAFHAVSSFNNAGFALYTDNLMGFVDDPFICLPIAAAIILGGLGFPVIMQLRKEFARPLHWSMNTKIVLLGTVVLLVAGTVVHHVSSNGTTPRRSERSTRGDGSWPASSSPYRPAPRDSTRSTSA